MGNPRGLGLHLISVCLILVATTYTCLGVGNMSVFCSEQERLALLKFKHNIKDKFGMLSSWVGNECCQWERIRCDSVTGNVQSLRLRGDIGSLSSSYIEGFYYSLVGEGYLVGYEVSSSLVELRHLKYLDLSGNDFQGSWIPEFIGSMKQLTYLNLSYSDFQGIIPLHIGNLSKLKVLDLGSNKGLMADNMEWTFGLSSLEHLDLSSVDLSGAQNNNMMFHMISSLKELSVSRCGLSDADLAPFFNSSRVLPNIKHLDLGFNSFKGPPPGFFHNMTSLASLDLSGFDLSLTWNFANLLNIIPSLLELHMSSCGLDKTFLSSSHLNFSTLTKIQYLNLSRNSIEGVFPSVLTNMSSLRVLDLSGNMLNSKVPIMPNLLELDLSYNYFTHIENVGLWRLANLRGINLSGNRLEGPIPESLGRLRSLEVLDLSHNELTGSIPTFFEKLFKLDLSFNKLNGTIPSSISLSSSSLSQLKLNKNNLIGELPQDLGNLRYLRVLDLGNNKLSGNLPEWIGEKLTYLVVLRLHKNEFIGRIPQSLCKTSNLQNLYVAYNKLTEIIPQCIGELNAIVVLNLSNNRLSGGIPQNIGNMINLKSLDLSSNELTGMIPPRMEALIFLMILDLSHNNLSGPIPTGNQFQALNDPSRYVGNKDLCGPPLPNDCSNREYPTTKGNKKHEATNGRMNVWLFYVDIMSGFATGFWGVIGVLLFKKQWRQKLFMFAEETIDKIYDRCSHSKSCQDEERREDT